MRRVETEGDSQSSRRRSRSVARSSLTLKPHLRRLALEGLEDRTLMSTLPAPVTTGQSFVGGGFLGGLTATPNSSSPSVAVDPLDPTKLIAAWTTYDPTNKLDGGNGQVTAYIQGAYSVDGGQTWAELPNDTVVDVQTDFSVARVTSGVQPDFAQTTDATVGFGRDETAYLLSSTSSGTGGVLDLQKWDFSTATASSAPASLTFTTPAYDTLSGTFFAPPSTVNPIYRWQGGDAALTPTLAVDNNVPTFSQGGTSQSDPHVGNVYVAWETNDAAPTGVTNYNPNLIKLMSSSDGGQNFTYQAYLSSSHGQGNTFDLPRIAISQGSATVPGGQVTIVYDNALPNRTVAPFFDLVQTQTSTTGGTDEHVDSATNVPITLGTNSIPFAVNITDPNFTTLQNLTLTLSLTYPNLGDTSASLRSPTGTTVILWRNATDAAGNATNFTGTLSGANIGASALSTNGFPLYIGTTLDSTAFRSLSRDGAAPYTGHFRPFGNLQNAFQGLGPGALNGTWTLNITQFRPETITPPTPFPTLYGASLDITAGLSDITDGPQSFVAQSFLNSGAHAFTDGIQGIPVLPNPSIASDNTLGSHSPHQGRLYIALADDNFNNVSGAYTTATFIELYYSDDAGASWTYGGIVNDDNGLTDGFSTGGYAQPGSVLNAANPPLASTSNPGVIFFGDPKANVRPKIEPQVAVDPYTGTLVVSFLDTRNDAASVRVANYIAASTDGGSSFAPEIYANPTSNLFNSPVIDAITSKPVNLGPIPDNQSAGNNNREATFGFGQRQGLAVANGHIIPVWSSNQNGTSSNSPVGSTILNSKSYLEIQSAIVTFAAGPRVIASTQGPVGEPGDTVNAARAADGSPIANTIVLTFDRAVDPATFPADGAAIGSSPIQVFYNNPSGTPVGVPLRVLRVTHDASDTIYTITFDPAGHGVGTYSYTLQPLVRGQIPFETGVAAGGTSQVPFIDTAVNGGQSSFTVSGHGNIQLTTATLVANADIYQKGTSTGSPTDLQIFLIAQDGTQYLLSSTTTQGQAADVGFDVSNTITIPAIPLELLDQTYTIKVVDNVPGEKVFVYNNVNPNDFNFQVQLSNQNQTSVTGNLLDQNANGVPGESPADNYSVPTGRNSLPLIVPGPHVTTTTVNGASGIISSGPDNLVTNFDPNSINVTFDRTMQVSTFTPAQILSVVGPTGRIDGPQSFPSTGTSRTFASSGTFQFIPKGGTLTSTVLISNTGLNVSNLSVKVNITDPNDASLALSLVAPDGTTVPLVLNNTAAGANFTDTVFSDAPPANGLTLKVPGAPAGSAAPYSLTYQPAMPLSVLAGKAIDGTWKLTIADSTSGGPQGRLNAWSLSITPRVPEGPGTQLNSSLVISSYPDNSFKIAHLAVQLNISSTKDSDLQVYLVAPDGTTTVPLILSAGGGGANFTNTILDDNGTIPIAQGVAPFSLTYKPAGPLSALNGLSIEGTWTLRIIDPNANGSVSTLNSWSLIATPQLNVTAVNPVAGGATTFKIGFPTQKLSGTYAVTLSPNILSVTPNPANPGAGAPLDTNLNAGVDALRGTSNGTTTTVNYAATSVPVAIPYAQKLPIGPVINGVLKSQINVPDNFAIQGDLGNLAGVTITLNISYYFDPDLTATLTSPNGKTVTLFMNVGKGSNTANFTNTTLSDVTTPPAPITAAGAPFFGTFNPQSSLTGLATDALGNQAFSQGLWTLTINNIGLDPGPGIDAIHPPALLSWSLALQKPQTNTGLGEPVADQKTVSFRLFNIAPNDPLANDTWTAVGPAGTTSAGNPLVGPINPITGVPAGNPGGVNLGGPVSVVALDPSDPSGNTAYIGASSGGVWRTTNFLTTAANGPTYVPLTDFGSNYTINIGGIAIFPQNNNPGQSIIFAGTGNGQATTASNGNSVQGVGILRSTNGGASFTLLDSSVNVDSSGNPLPINSPLRDHVFVGTTTYKVVVDPTPLPGGGVLVYAALGGKNGGLWRSLDGGNSWQNLSAGTVPQVNGQNAAATDVLLDPVSVSPSTHNLDILYAAFQGVGVFISTNRGQALTELFGTVGATNLIQNSLFAPAKPLTVNDANTPNGAFGRIVLAKPALTNSAAQNILYQDWVYAAVENTDGTFRGLYITKDRGENWTKAQIASNPSPGLTVTDSLPTNDNTQANNYDVSNGVLARTHNGNSAFSMAVDPLDPNIVYLGGTQDYQTSGLIRVDLTGLYDAHAYVPFANDRNDGGKLSVDSTGRAVTNQIQLGIPFYEGTNPSDPSQQTGDYYVNLRHNPTNPFDTSSTLFVANSDSFLNDGTGVKWTPLDTAYLLPMQGSTNVHQLLPILDPLTGLTRLIVSDDQGVFTGLFNADGTLDTGGIGTAAAVNGSLNGNLQDEQLYQSAAQPSTLAAQTAGALFYGSGIGMTHAQSAADLLSTGNLTWTVLGPAYGDLQNLIGTNDRGGTGIATDQTGGVTANSPSSPSAYEFDVPFVGGDTTNFFRVNTNGQTTGLVNNYQVEFPANNVVYNGVIPLGYFAVNPINGTQILISSTLGNVYETVNKGAQWLQIGAGQAVAPGKADFDGTYAPALAYGAPDPNAPAGVGNLNNFLYVGTVGGHIYVTQNGAAPWTALSTGLDGSSIVSIFTNPNRGSHEAYAITLKGVYYMADSIASASNPTPTWVNITGNLSQIQHNSFNDPTLAENSLLGYQNPSSTNGGNTSGQLGGFRSIVADYRYAVPDPVVPTTRYPVLYVAGYGGVFRSLDNGASWAAFPNIAFDSAPADGGYLPNVDVTSLQLNLGAINPATGHATQVAGDPEVLLASTLGRGDFAIRLAPTVFPTTIGLDPTLPAPGGSATGAVNGNPLLTNLVHPYIDGDSEISNFGNLVTITLIDEATGVVIGTGTTDTFGHFSVMVGSLAGDPSFAVDGVKRVGIQATDSSGAKGNVTIFTYTLKATPPPPPTNLTLVTDSGRFNNDDITNVVPPVFSVNTSEPATTKVELFRFNASLPVGQQYELVDTQMAGRATVTLTDTRLAIDFPMPPTINMQFTYYALQVDQATNPSTPLNNIGSDPTKLTITIDTILPPAPNAPTLDPSTNSGLNPSANITNSTHPLFDVTGLQANDNLELFRSIGGSTPILVGTAAVGATQVRDTAGVPADGVYLYQVAQVDVAGNVSPLSMGVVITINTKTPAAPTLVLFPADDTGAPTHPDVTTVRSPRFIGTGTPGLGIVILSVTGTNFGQGVPITPSVTVAPDGTYLASVPATKQGSLGPLADGVYTLVARTINAAGNVSYSTPLTVTIKATGPQILPSLSILAADNTGLKTDSVTANRRPRFVGSTDKGVTVTLYTLTNGQLSAPLQTTSSSTIDGSFQIQLPFTLSNGSIQLVAQASDIAGNKGLVSPALSLRIITVAGDYTNSGAAQFAVFQPTNETYYTLYSANTADTTPGRDVPIQYDVNGDGKIDPPGYRFDSATYFGPLSSGGNVNFQFGNGGVSLPVSGYFDTSGTFEYGLYNVGTATWALYLPRPGGEVLNFGAPKIDIPVPAAYDGNGVTEIATFRPSVVKGNDADSFNVVAPNFSNNYQVSFTDPTVPALKAFTYKAGDIPAPADYDGIGKDEFAIYRPTTGQFFILKVPNLFDKTTWTLRTVTLNLPGGPKVGDQPVSEDYEGTGKASPTVYRPSNAMFYEIQTTNGIQRSIQLGVASTSGVIGSVAAAGPLLYRLTALYGPYASTGGYNGGVVTSAITPGSGPLASAITVSPGVHADALVNTSTATGGGSSQVLPGSSTIALAMPTAVVTPAPVAPTPVPTVAIPTVTSPTIAPTVISQVPNPTVTFGATILKSTVQTHVASRPVAHPAHVTKAAKPAKPVHKAAAPATSLKVETSAHQTKSSVTHPDQHQAAVAAALVHLAPIKKGRNDD